MRRESFAKFYLLAALVSSAALSACAPADDRSSESRAPIAAYCPYVTSPRTFATSVTITGSAKFDYRVDGAGLIPDGTNVIQPIVPANGATTSFSFQVNGTPIAYTCSSPCTLTNAVKGLATAVNLLSTIKSYGITALSIYNTSSTTAPTLSNLSNMQFLNAKPIRFAEVRATSANGSIVQCAETDSAGAFTMDLPDDGATYTVSVISRSSNAANTAYVMNAPKENQPYAINRTVQTTANASLNFRALATGTLEGAAFNILDQIADSQAFLRAQTAGCDNPANPNYFSGCVPFTTAPTVYAYWTVGLSPGVYYGISGPISYYLGGQRELYILGGVSGNTTTADMDHFDNSVIVHEYGHFIEDQFASPDSPGGSHNGNAIIDPRLAWGEGFANFFQAAVTGVPFYRDTSGYLKSGCGVNCNTTTGFNEPLHADFGTTHDEPSELGEGNFREFSVARVLWSIIQPSVSRFSEVWTAFNGTSGMRVVADAFKSIGRLHVIHSGITNSGGNTVSWASVQSTENQRPNFADYATRLDLTPGCSPASKSMSIKVVPSDSGSFGDSNQFRNNDFYLYNHPGGVLSAEVSWSGGDQADLDLYVYKPGYVFGDTSSSSVAAMDQTDGLLVASNASVSRVLPAGAYMINVMAYTWPYPYSASTFYKNTTYTLKIGGQTACPSSL